jgi:dipeptidyl aminopeptidase/acylaminoacyl peptidase
VELPPLVYLATSCSSRTTGSTGYGEAFARESRAIRWRPGADDVNQAADEAIKRYPYLDPARQAAGGASYGGHLANWLEATTDRYRCLISHAGLSSLQTQWSTSDSVTRSRSA